MIRVRGEGNKQTEMVMEREASGISRHQGVVVENEVIVTGVERPPKAALVDIKNKANTACSVCMVTFDSSRSFVKHCHVDHKMKLKTKAGIPLSLCYSNYSYDIHRCI